MNCALGLYDFVVGVLIIKSCKAVIDNITVGAIVFVLEVVMGAKRRVFSFDEFIKSIHCV